MTILLIEDNHDLVQYLASHLAGTVLVAGNLAQGLNYLATEAIDLILLDLGLPDSDGMDTIDALSKVPVPKIVITANADLAAQASGRGIQDYIVKCDPRDMVARIQFNLNKLKQSSKSRFRSEVFEQVKGHICIGAMGRKLTPAR